MNQENKELDGPDLAQGIEISAVPDRTMLLAHAHGEAVLLIRRGDEMFAIGTTCTHYGAPLVDQPSIPIDVLNLEAGRGRRK
jgi:nitrite reductase/ring-hydroxylating ferredoxin subunit